MLVAATFTTARQSEQPQASIRSQASSCGAVAFSENRTVAEQPTRAEASDGPRNAKLAG